MGEPRVLLGWSVLSHHMDHGQSPGRVTRRACPQPTPRCALRPWQGLQGPLPHPSLDLRGLQRPLRVAMGVLPLSMKHQWTGPQWPRVPL